ncbi:MAG: hypothetical protein RXR43_10140 [Sulfolobus sp.]
MLVLSPHLRKHVEDINNYMRKFNTVIDSLGQGFDSLKKIDEGEVIDVIDYVQGSLIYQKNDSVYLDKKKIIKSDYPILGVSSLK